jgi:hypothetical protein
MRVTVGVLIAMGMIVFVIVGMSLIVRVWVIVRVFVIVGVVVIGLAGHDVDFGSGNAGAADSARLKASANVQRNDRFRHFLKKDACINHGAEEHVAADARKAFQISNTHRG